MKIANIVVIILGSLLIIGIRHKGFVKSVGKFSSWFLPFASGSLAMSSTIDNKDKDLMIKLLLVVTGGLLILCSVFSVVFE